MHSRARVREVAAGLAAHRRTKVLFSRPEVQHEMKDEKAFEPEMIRETCCWINVGSTIHMVIAHATQNVHSCLEYSSEDGHQINCFGHLCGRGEKEIYFQPSQARSRVVLRQIVLTNGDSAHLTIIRGLLTK